MKKMMGIVLAMSFVVTAEAAPKGTCVFGDDTGNLRENKRFQIQEDVIRTFKSWRSVGPSWRRQDDKPPLVKVAIVKDLKTGNVYHLNETFRHIDDGDNTVGWIEEVNNAEELDSGYDGEGRVVAEVGDSDIGRCLVRE